MLLGSGGKLSTEKIIAGMKEALRVGIDTTIKIVGMSYYKINKSTALIMGTTGIVDGFLLNMMIRILLPPKLAEIADALKKFFGAHYPLSVCSASLLSLSFLRIALLACIYSNTNCSGRNPRV